MLSLGLGSTCDVCLEPFGPESKGPCSIQCGHVFCVDCLNHLARPQCPLCRDPFEPHSVVRLHVDVENVQRTSPKAPQSCATAAEQEARRLQDAIANVANTGSSEANLRSLIEECRKFLAGQSRNLFPELRIAHRMIAYLCEVKASLVAQTQACNALQSQVSQLGAEKGDLEKRIQDLKETRKYERQTALTVEKNLRDHCSRAHEAYETVVEQYNFVVSEWMRLQHEVRLLRLPPTPQPEPTTPDMDIELDMAKTPQPRPMAELDQTKLRSAAVQDPESYLISPLPQFTGRLPDAATLPDEDEARDRLKTKGATTKSPRRQDSSLSFQSFVLPPTPQTPSLKDCGAAGHPWTCNCQEFVIFNEGTNTPGSRRPSFTNPLPTPVSETQPKAPPPTPNGISHSTPMSPGRARSYTIPTHNSRPPSRAPSPKPRPTSGPRNIYSPSSGHSSLQGKETESLKSRLHDLLQDNAGVSSSLPNMPSSHFPASFARETPQSTQKAELSSRPPSRSGATPLQHRVNPMSPKQSDSERPRVSPQITTSSVTPPTPSASSVPPAPVYSRASNAAMVLEKERKEKKEQERERRRLEKEKTRAAEQETLNRSGSISNSSTTGSAGVSANYGRSHTSPGRDSAGPHGSQRHMNIGSGHGSGSIAPSTSPTIYT